MIDIKKSALISDDEKIKITVQSNNEIHILEGINIFGGIIDQYQKDKAFTIVKPFAVGQFTPGMLLSHVSGLIAYAVEAAIEFGMPSNIIKELGHLAIEEGASGGKKNGITQ